MAAATSLPEAELAKALVMEPVEPSHWLIILPIAWCIMFGAVLIALRKSTDRQPLIALPGLGGLVLMTGLLLKVVVDNGPITMTMGRWLPPFGIAFTVDIMGALFAFAGAIAALAAGIYALKEVDSSSRRYGFYPFLLLMMAGVTGAFLTGDIFNLYVWFEVLLIASFGLLILGSEHEQIDGAMKYAILNLMGTTLFLIATGYLYSIFGTLNMADIAVRSKEMTDAAPLMTLASLYLLAFAMKAAAFPVNFWLPASYHTPRVAVAGVFAGLLTKVGVYALIRTLIMLLPAGHRELGFVLELVAASTMIVGVLGALAQNDARRMFGYLVISGIGVMLAGIALGTQDALSGAVFYALHSMIAMLAIYLLGGVANKLSGTHELSWMGGLYGKSPLSAVFALAIFFSIAGLPPFSGFWPKVMLVKASFESQDWWLAGTILLTGFLTTITLGRFFALAWWRPGLAGQAGETLPAKMDTSAMIAVAALVVVITGFGVLPNGLMALTDKAAEGVLNPAAYIQSVFPEGAPEQ
ncbi:Na+/H+ antiporter subunit D [Rhizobium sp. L1K21]|uniref:Na+/H+ antiporter subunit D n=1 Tax=Rhizobium sp. L1K21 TaxID=2954933 RepID=UPI002093F83E|nr:Na+/H+ antiporter subunit D [Rhizobium sp. L1K21]MCO6186730.1 Na+/H+ antiporter subunit D [Rhizobium sp. L1K21]